MTLLKLGKKGQLTIPKSVLKPMGITDGTTLLLEMTSDGAIVLRQVGIYPIELYSEQRVREFEQLNTIPPAIQSRAASFLWKKKKR